ncbi:MAG: MATE family efflux transporter [Saccharofermentans sp.]|nr:MATE family efflux transporter [Saccharofermentans sp.]
MGNEKLLREGSVARLLISLSLPVILVMLVNVIYNMADVFFLGQTGNTLQVAAVSLAGPLFGVISALNTLLGFGACTAASISLGEGDNLSIRRYSSFCLYTSLLLGGSIAILIRILMNPVLTLLGANTETAGFASSYLRILSIGAPFMVAAGSLGNLYRADGECKGALISSLLGTIVNIVLDPLFISLLGWGVEGAAWATVAGNICSFGLILFAIRKKNKFSLSIRDYSLKKEVSIRIFSLGIPMAAGTLLMSFSGIFSNRILVSHGNSTVAASAVAGKAGMLIGMLLMGICIGIQPAISYAFGQKNIRRMNEIVRKTTLIVAVIGGLLGCLLILIREQFICVFLDDPGILKIAKLMVIGGVVSAPVSAVNQMCQTFLQSTGQVRYATLTALLQKGIIYIPVLFGMHMIFGLNGYIWSGLITDILATAAGIVLCVHSGIYTTKSREHLLSAPDSDGYLITS